MSKTKILFSFFLILMLSALGVVGYWFYSTQSLRSHIISTIGNFASFEYADYHLEGLSEYKSRVVFSKPIFRVELDPTPLFLSFDKLAFTANSKDNKITLENPSATITASSDGDEIVCKNITKAMVESVSHQNGLTLSVLQDAVECYLQDKKIQSDSAIFDLLFEVAYTEKVKDEKATHIIAKIKEKTKDIRADLTVTRKINGTPAYTVDTKEFTVSTPEYSVNLNGNVSICPSYSSVMKGKICLAIEKTKAVFSMIEENLSGSEKESGKKLMDSLRSFMKPNSDTLAVCLQEKNEELVVRNTEKEKLLREML